MAIVAAVAEEPQHGPPEQLAGVWAKLERANVHLAELQAAVQDFRDSDFYEIKTDLPEKGRILGRAVNVKTPGPDFGVLLGDLVHCLRSTLDHMVSQLALGHTDRLPADWAKTSAFPIFKTGPRFRGEAGRGHGTGRGAAYKLRGVSPSAQKAIERLQPYHRRKHPLLWALWMLEELSNIDKHRLLPTTGALTAEGLMAIQFHRPIKAVGKRDFPGPIEENRPLVQLRGAFESPDDVSIEANITPDIIFDKRADPKCVRGLPLRVVIDGIFTAFAAHVFPELNPEFRRLFGRGINFSYGQANPGPPGGIPAP